MVSERAGQPGDTRGSPDKCGVARVAGSARRQARSSQGEEQLGRLLFNGGREC